MPDKAAMIAEYRLHDSDTGSPEVQIALLQQRITHLTQHLKEHKHDHHTRRGLMKLIGKQKRLRAYLRDNDIERYRALISRLGIRGCSTHERAERLARFANIHNITRCGGQLPVAESPGRSPVRVRDNWELARDHRSSEQGVR